MAFIHSKNTVITVDGDDLSDYVTSSSELDESTAVHDTTAYGLDDERYSPGLNGAKFTMEGTYDDTASTGPIAVLDAVKAGNAAVTIVRQPAGAGMGKAQQSFSAILTTYKTTAPVGDMSTFAAEFQVTGAIDKTAQS